MHIYNICTNVVIYIGKYTNTHPYITHYANALLRTKISRCKCYALLYHPYQRAVRNFLSFKILFQLHFGVNSGASRFAIEHQAVNEATFRCPDEMGWKPQVRFGSLTPLSRVEILTNLRIHGLIWVKWVKLIDLTKNEMGRRSSEGYSNALYLLNHIL